MGPVGGSGSNLIVLPGGVPPFSVTYDNYAFHIRIHVLCTSVSCSTAAYCYFCLLVQFLVAAFYKRPCVASLPMIVLQADGVFID